MKAKHTPMPWTTIRCEDGMEVLTHDAESICVVKHYGDPYDSKREEANARLIAAAPELLDALKDAADQLFRLALADAHRWTGDANRTKALEHANKVCAPARAVIAKATGNTI